MSRRDGRPEDPAVEHRQALVRVGALLAAVAAVPLARKWLSRSNTQMHRHEPGRR